MDEDSENLSVLVTSAIYGLVAGLLHTSIAIFFWNYFLYDNLSLTTPAGVYIIIGMFALGFVPVMCFTTQKSISPVLLVSILLVVSVYSEWQGYFSPKFGGPRAFSWYILLWVGVVLLAGLASNIEYTFRQQEIEGLRS